MGSFKPSVLFPGGPRGDLSVGVLWSWGVRSALLAAEKNECEQRRMRLCLRSSSCVRQSDRTPRPLTAQKRTLSRKNASSSVTSSPAGLATGADREDIA